MLVYKANVEIGKASRLLHFFIERIFEIFLATGITTVTGYKPLVVSLVAQTCDSKYLGG